LQAKYRQRLNELEEAYSCLQNVASGAQRTALTENLPYLREIAIEQEPAPQPQEGNLPKAAAGRVEPKRRVSPTLIAALVGLLTVGAVAGWWFGVEKPRQDAEKQRTAGVAEAQRRAEDQQRQKEELARTAFDNATKDHPWVNSLGMKFVPVRGTDVLFSIWDTRVQDFEMFVKSTGYDATGDMSSLDSKEHYKLRGATWKEPGFSQGSNHPVVGVSWNDAEEFCKWLTKRERSARALPEEREYRLPTDEEWSAAVDKRATSWPPPSRAGNYAGKEAKNEDWPPQFPVIDGYNDGYPRTSRVGSFEANYNGLHDMGGNVWQWCEDWYNAEAKYHVLRGASWVNGDPVSLLASYRGLTTDVRNGAVGFRCVVGVESAR
jgi:Sulfatase-modifying factor enzyme 1